MGSKKEQVGRQCPYCGAMITFDEFFCRACHRKLTDQQNFDAPSTARPDTYIVNIRKLYISAITSAIFPGFGQFYNGDAAKGLVFNFIYLTLAFSDFGAAYHAALILGVWIIALAEAVVSAWRINNFKRASCGTSRLLYIEIVGILVVLGLHLYLGQPDMAYLEKLFPAAYVWQV